MRDNSSKQSATPRPDERIDVRAELDRLEVQLADLKVLYEQYFSGILALPPDPQHREVKRKIRFLMKAPFKNSAMNYRLRTLENRYHTFNTYWQRTLKQKEDGTYSKDVFKAAMRERVAIEEARMQTATGKAQKSMESLFGAYRSALEQQTGKKQKIDYESFEKSLLQRAKDFKEKSGASKLSFKVVVKNGKVTVQIKGKKSGNEQDKS